MKILYLAMVDFPRRVANQVQMMKMAEAFSRSSDLVLAATALHMGPSELWKYYGIRTPFTIEVLGEPRIRPKTLFALPNILRCIRRNKPDVVYVRQEYLGWLVSFFCKYLVYEMLDFQPRFKRFYPRLLRHSMRTVVISEGLKGRIVEEGLPSDKLTVCPDGVDLDAFDTDVKKNEARRLVGLPGQGKFVLYAGRFSQWKGVQTLIESAQYLGGGIQILLVGGFEGESDALQASIDRLNVQSRVTIVGHKEHSQIPLYLKAADALVIPTSGSSELAQNYTSPLKLFEYMAARRPIVASDLSSMREIVDEMSATLVPPDDPRALADGLAYALADGAEIEEKVSNAYQKVREYSWDRRAQRILAGVSVGNGNSSASSPGHC